MNKVTMNHKQSNKQGAMSKEHQQQGNTLQAGKHQTDNVQSQQQNDKNNVVAQHNYPKVSNNFGRYDHNFQNFHKGRNNVIMTPSNNEPSSQNHQNQQNPQPIRNSSKKDLVPKPSPYTIIQSFASRLRQNLEKNDIPIGLVSPIITTKQEFPTVIFDKDDFMIKLAAKCKFTLIGKFTNTMSKVELIRRKFILQNRLSGVKIAHFNARHMYIDLDYELGYITVWTKQKITIEGKLMRIQTWTPTFKPDKETPIVTIWISLLELPWHCFNKEFLVALLNPIGNVLYLDTASIQKTRGSLAKVKVYIDLTKERPPHVWIGFDEEDLNIRRWQAIQYESVPDYCMYCKNQGQMIHACTIKKR
ncbi:hypothetical protein KY285_030637 [Solanum tuberosum]|nr:hypothetical protein KY285_030637 [Solanum tuberosum]